MKQYSRWLAGLVLAPLFFAHSSLAADSATPALPYVRLSRAFFEKTVHADINLVQPTGKTSSYSSDVKWVEYPPAASAETSKDPQLGQVLADFSDFVACAEMTDLGQARLCFKVMGDVSNLGLNDREMTLRGIDTIPSDGNAAAVSAECSAPASTPSSEPSSGPAADGGAPSRYQLQKAEVSTDTVRLDFKYSNNCGPNVQLTLTQVP